MSENNFEQGFKAVCDHLVALAKERGVVATPIEVGDTTILPLSELRLGFGGGGGQGQGEGGDDSGQSGQGRAMASAGAGNVKVTPIGFIVIEGDTISLESVDEDGGAK